MFGMQDGDCEFMSAARLLEEARLLDEYAPFKWGDRVDSLFATSVEFESR